MSLFFGCVAWLANILFLLALLFFLIGWRWLTVISSGLTLLLSLDTFRLFLIELPGDEGGVASSISTDVAAWCLVVAGKHRRHFCVCLDPAIGTQERFATCSVRVNNKVMPGSFSQGAEHCINDCPKHEKESELRQPGHTNSG